MPHTDPARRQETARAAAQRLRALGDDGIARFPALIGFDGFVDAIIHVVDQRHSTAEYTAIPTIARYAEKIAAAAGQSANFELVTQVEKLGGNGPIMANALGSLGLPITYVGNLGQPEVHPVFAEFARRNAVLSIAQPGLTDALEFEDGKLMLGKHDALREVHQSRIDAVIGRDRFAELVGRSVLLGMVNWTMLTEMETIWRRLIDEVLPAAPDAVGGRRRVIFIDLADPEKRTREDLRGALGLCTDMAGVADVVLGLNLKESVQVAEVLGVAVEGDPEGAIETTAAGIREALGLYAVVVHPRRSAAAAVADPRRGGRVETGFFAGPFTDKPRLSTGAGDNFNAGFCLGLLADLPVEQALCVGTATSGYYVRNADSPSLEQLAAFCEDLPDPA